VRGLADPLRRYQPGRHRLELVATVGGVDYIDDSKATNPHAAAAALAAHAPRDGEPVVVWIAGGLGKGLEFASLEPYVAASVRAAVTIGTSGPAIAELVRRTGKPVTEAADMGTAVRAAATYARPGDKVLLAPACASMDQFRNYAERGAVFRAHVADLEVSDV
jgi:UDP-N-acetylmuramoylalanine--D-glutamate ligase